MFSAPLMFRDKAQWVTRAGPMSAANAVGLPCKARLAMNADKLTEYDNISLEGHWCRW
jgi:hypothetical protein